MATQPQLELEPPVAPAAGRGRWPAAHAAEPQASTNQRSAATCPLLLRRPLDIALAGKHHLAVVSAAQTDVESVLQEAGGVTVLRHCTGRRQFLAGLEQARHGLLLLGDLSRFDREALRAVSSHLGDREIHGCIVVATVPPCACRQRRNGHTACRCTAWQRSRYLTELTAPVREAFDLQVTIADDVANMDTGKESAQGIDWDAIGRARDAQARRYQGKGFRSNGQLTPAEVEALCLVGARTRAMLHLAIADFNLSRHASHQILRVARTIADMGGAVAVDTGHVSEAVGYRVLDQTLWW